MILREKALEVKKMPIKVLISTNKLKGGPATFRSRLIDSLNKIEDIKVITNEKEKFDIGIEFIRKNSKYSQPYILRASSCYYLYKYKIYNNKPIFKSIKKSVHTIFQSNFAYKLCNKVLSLEDRGAIARGHSIIYNGIDIIFLFDFSPRKCMYLFFLYFLPRSLPHIFTPSPPIIYKCLFVSASRKPLIIDTGLLLESHLAHATKDPGMMPPLGFILFI